MGKSPKRGLFLWMPGRSQKPLGWCYLAAAFALVMVALLEVAVAVRITAGVMCLVSAGLWAWGQRWGVVVTERGFTEYFWLGLPRRHRWEDVREVDEQPHHGRIAMARGELRLDDSLRSWRKLVARAREAVGERPLEEPVGPPIPPEQVEGWLGIEPDGAVRFRTLRAWQLVVPVAVYLVVPALVLVEIWFIFHLLAPTLCFGVCALVAMAVSVRVLGGVVPWGIDARGDGIVLHYWGRRRTVAWKAVRGVRRSRFWRLVSTTDDDFSFHVLNREGLTILAAMEQAIQAREQGFSLPQVHDVPDGALSTSAAEPEEAVVERGLSQPDG